MIILKNQLGMEQLNIVKSLAERSGVSFETAKILYSRGIDTVAKVKRFLAPGKQHFLSPMLFKGMAEAVERITAARDMGETVVIYGDYDADGVCATAILYYALKEFGIEANTVIPERADGYGLSEKLIDEVMEQYNPDLIITVDCGISGYREVEYIQDLGVDIIVTDHHELPEILPQCITVNCKFRDQEYEFDSLCGAGVAFKLATALIGKKAERYLDFAALATVADSMPLIDENRDIVVEGTRLIRSANARTAFKALIEAAKVREITSTALAYSLAPRINAAGRMGDAASALRLFLSDTPSEIFDLAALLNKYNIERQVECDALYASAKSKLLEKGADKRVIVLEDSEWKNGLVGIVAAKLVEEFTRPVIMFVNKDGVLHGSARSVEEINILDAIIQNKEFLEEFGGHSQAAGVTVRIENLNAFEEGLNKYISERYGDEVFVPKQEIEDYIEDEFSISFARELARLEPFGTGNKKPLFALEVDRINPAPLKDGSPHVSFKTDHIDMIYFGGAQYEKLLRAPVKKTLVFEPNLSSFGGRESLRGYVKNFEVEVVKSRDLGLDVFAKNLRNLRKTGGGDTAEYLTSLEIAAVIEEALSCPYGTLFVVSTLKTLEYYPRLKHLPVHLNEPRYKNLSNCIVLALTGGDISGFKRVVFLDNPLYEAKRIKGKEVCVNADVSVRDMLPSVDATREGVGAVFTLLRSRDGFKATCSFDLYAGGIAEAAQISRYQLIFAAEVLEELGIIRYENGRMRYDKTVKSDLASSKIYSNISGRN
ncbi:MAG: single-stranded-DNA-specific exonuclease RecJ [Clostridia bacterium]|nr:single-stranded-DNA-specific exonuclease RecJ [Clostridia bacterium]